MALLSVIRRWHLREGMPIREISRRTGLSRNTIRKQRRSIRQLHSDLVQLGYSGSYDRVAAFARQWRQDQQEALRTVSKNTFVPLQFAPGEAFQFEAEFCNPAAGWEKGQVEKGVRDARHRL